MPERGRFSHHFVGVGGFEMKNDWISILLIKKVRFGDELRYTNKTPPAPQYTTND